jgi:hypothetical protein
MAILLHSFRARNAFILHVYQIHTKGLLTSDRAIH